MAMSHDMIFLMDFVIVINAEHAFDRLLFIIPGFFTSLSDYA